MNIHQKMNAVMKAVRGVAKTQRNTQGGGYMYAGHERVTDALRDQYVAHGILRTASVTTWQRDERGGLSMLVKVSWANIEEPSDRVEVLALGEAGRLTKEGGISPVQAGIAFSYAVKNAEFKAFSLTGDDTPDGEVGDDQADAAVDEFIARFEGARTQEAIDEIANELAHTRYNKDRRAELIKARGEAVRRVAAR